MSARRMLVSNKIASLGARVIEVDSGAEALALLSTQPIDLAIVDLEMPMLDGFDLLGCIRGHPRCSHIPVIVLTGREDLQSLERALSAGATSYLGKPLNWAAFGRHIAHMLHLAQLASSVVRISA